MWPVKRRVLWAISSFFMAVGATALVAMVWRQTDIAFARSFAPHVVAAALTGLTLARVLERRAFAIAFAAGATLLWIGGQFVAFRSHGAGPHYLTAFGGSALAHYAMVAAVATPIAAACAAPRLRGRRNHRLLWLWISTLVMFGTIIAPITMLTSERFLPLAGVLVVVLAPLVAGAAVQILAPYRAIWTCGGGALFFILLVLDRNLRGNGDNDIVGPLCGMGIFVVLGALGAKIGWRLFRNKDPRTPPAPLPTASIQGDV